MMIVARSLGLQVIKQSHMILKFLAVETRVTAEHVELVWAAAQLKHCGRQVYDLLPGFIRALAPKPCAHLYALLCALPPKDHTEQVPGTFRCFCELTLRGFR